jgi:hypothetical protein
MPSSWNCQPGRSRIRSSWMVAMLASLCDPP